MNKEQLRPDLAQGIEPQPTNNSDNSGKQSTPLTVLCQVDKPGNAKGIAVKQDNSVSLCVPATTVDEALKWVEQTDPDEIAKEWTNKIRFLAATGQNTVKKAISTKTRISLRPLNAVLKAAKVNWKKVKIKSMNSKQAAKRKTHNIVGIEFDEANTRKVTLEAARALANDNTPGHDLVLRYGSELVSIQSDSPKTAGSVTQLLNKNIPNPKMSVIRPYVTNTLRHRLEQAAIYLIRDTENGDRTVQWPKLIIDGIGQQNEVKFPPLTGVVPHPFIGVNGAVFAKQGYDKATGLFARHNNGLGKNLPINPTKTDINRSLTFITDIVFEDFPFADRIDEITAVAVLLTALQRKVITDDSGCPGFLFDAPTQGTGKTILAQVINYSIFGKQAAATSWSSNDNEMGKHILAILREGHSCVLFDNVPEGSCLTSNELAKAMTGNSYSGRMLGGNTTITVPTNILWLFTGNNISICGDFNSRILPIRLDSQEADPDHRTFKRPNIGMWCMEHRAEIIRACLTIVMGDGSATPNITGQTRYPGWNKYVRLPLLAASGVDVADLFQRNKTSDPEMDSKKSFLEAMFKEYGGKSVTAKDICQNVANPNSANGTIYKDSALGDVFADLFPENIPSSRVLGIWLGKLKGQIICDYRLTSDTGKTGDNKNRSVWTVEKVD